jgi:hypothetical protein
MQRVLPNLLWKEWHEQRWMLGFGSLLLAAFAVVGLRARLMPDETLLSGLCFTAATLLPVLACAGLVPADRADGSLDALLSLPLRPWQALLAKTASGVALCVGPLATAAVVGMAVAGGREMPAVAIATLFARGAAVSLSLFAWMLALTIRIPSEARAGLLAVGVIVAWLIVVAGLVTEVMPQEVWLVDPFKFAWFDDPWIHVEPLHSAVRARDDTAVAPLVAQATVAAALWALAAWRFGSSAGRRG